MVGLDNLPQDAAGLQLCKVVREKLILCEEVMFSNGRSAVENTLRRADVSGTVGPLGQTGDFWADVLNADGDMIDNIALDRGSWNSLKNRWMRCRIQKGG